MKMQLPTMITTISLLTLPLAVTAFSSISPNYPPPSYNNNNRGSLSRNDDAIASSAATPNTCVQESAPWRVTLDLGREPLSRMPFDWARSGCRMPLVVGVDFEQQQQQQQDPQTTKKKLILPRSDTVSFTGPGGAVVRPVVGGEWDLDQKKQELSFTLTFPEFMARRDVTVDAGTTMYFTGRVYTQTELDELNDAYYKAREATWEVGGQLNQIVDRQGAAKKWNDITKQWEKRHTNENPFTVAQKQFQYWSAKARQNQKNNQRPNPKDISDRGSFPGVPDGLYVARGGVIRQGKNGPVMGKWYAQPITDQPVSYRN